MPAMSVDMPGPWIETKPASKDEKDRAAPTILKALLASTREERLARGPDGEPSEANRTCATALHGIMLEWARALEPNYRESDEQWDFYLGRHYSYWSAALNTRVLMPEPTTNVIRLTLNYIEGWVERCVTLILSDPPAMKCVAGSEELVDQAASEAADFVVEWRQQQAELAADHENVARAACAGSICWVHEEWNSAAGPPVQLLNDDGSPQFRILGDDGQPLPQPEPMTGPQGDFHRDILTHRQGVPDPAATHPFRGSGFFVRPRMSRFEFEQLFPGRRAPKDNASEGDERQKRVADLGRGQTSSSQGGVSGADPAVRDECEPVILYVPKCEAYERGCRIVFTRDEIVEEVDNPRYPTEEEAALGEAEPNPCEEPPWPVFPFPYRHRPQSPMGASPVKKAIQPNKAINALASVSVQHVAQVGRAKIKVPNDLAQDWSDQIQVFKVPRRGFDHNSLGYIAPPPMSPENVQLWREFKTAGLEFMDLNEPAVGQDQGGEDSGYKVRLQQNAASTAIQKVRARFNAMWACVYGYDALLWRRHADTKRTIQLFGEKQTQMRALDRTAIMAGTRVRCVQDAAIPRDPQAKMIWLKDFLATGVMQLPEKQQQEIFELMSLQNVTPFVERHRADRARAERQILRIEEGKEPGGISEIDDHLVQMDVLRAWMLSQAFETRCENELQQSQAQGAPPASPTFTRAMTLYKAHAEAVKAQVAAQSPPPASPAGGPPAQPASPPAAAA